MNDDLLQRADRSIRESRIITCQCVANLMQARVATAGSGERCNRCEPARLGLVSSAWKRLIGLPPLWKIEGRIEFEALGIKPGAQIHLPDTRSGRSLPFPVLLDQIASLRNRGIRTRKQLFKLVECA
jgi:hypothetical protein